RGIELLLLPGRLQAPRVRDNPDLVEVNRLAAAGVELAVQHPAPGGDALQLAWPQDRAVAPAVAMLELATQDVGDNLHVTVWMGAKAGVGGDAVLIDHAQ